MKKLANYIIENVDENIINESFQCSVFDDVNKAFAKQQEYYDEEKRKYLERWPDEAKSYDRYHTRRYDTFKTLIANMTYYNQLRFDKITDDMVEEMAPNHPHLSRKIRYIIKGTSKNIAVGYRKNEVHTLAYDEKVYIWCTNDVQYYTSSTQRDKITIFQHCDNIKIIDIDKHPEVIINNDDKDSKNSRRESQRGVILQGDKEFCDGIILANKERWKKALRQRNNYTDEQITELIEIVNDVFSKAEELRNFYFSESANVIDANYYRFRNIMATLYKDSYNDDSLLCNLKKVIEYKEKTASGKSDEYDRRWAKRAEENIRKYAQQYKDNIQNLLDALMEL